MATARAYGGNTCLLKLDGVEVGVLRSFEGGDVTAEVIHERVGPSYVVRKHIGPPRYEPITLEFGLSMGAPIRDWIQSSLTMNYQRKNGSIIVVDYNFNAVREIEFFNALITELTIPKMDGSSKEAAYFTLKIQPEMTHAKKASGKISAKLNTKTVQWLTSNFRLNLDGLDTSKVITIDELAIKGNLIQEDIGITRDYMVEPTSVEFPNLKITFSAVTAQSWEDWFENFVIKGNNDEGQERHGSITCLSPTLTEELLTIELSSLGIFSLKTEKAEANVDQVQRMTAQLYCQSMAVKFGK